MENNKIAFKAPLVLSRREWKEIRVRIARDLSELEKLTSEYPMYHHIGGHLAGEIYDAAVCRLVGVANIKRLLLDADRLDAIEEAGE